MKWKQNISKPVGYRRSSSKKQVYSNKCLHQKSGKFLINNLIMYLREKLQAYILEKHRSKNLQQSTSKLNSIAPQKTLQ